MIIALTLAIAFGLLFIMADTGKAPDKERKKSATPRPSVTIEPYRIPLPMMGSGVNATEKSLVLIRR